MNMIYYCPNKCPCDKDYIHSINDHLCNICGYKGYTHNEKACPYMCPCSINESSRPHRTAITTQCSICGVMTNQKALSGCQYQQHYRFRRIICDKCGDDSDDESM